MKEYKTHRWSNIACRCSVRNVVGDLPKTKIKTVTKDTKEFETLEPKIDLENDLELVLRHPSVSSKQFLITIGDRSVGGLTARDQMIGRYQVPTSNYALR